MSELPPAPRRSPLAFVVLALLAEAPMHAYRMQQLIKERGKDRVVNVARRNSVTQAVDLLLRDGLITIQETRRDQYRPERTIYWITSQGHEVFQRWMREMLSTPAREFPRFPAALAFLGLFSCADVLRQLQARASALEHRLAETAEAISDSSLPRVFLIEEEYLRAMTMAELRWVRSITDELESGELHWDTEELLTFVPPG
ncbi:MAG: PadR family transcriptional regulator [Pseudonocardiaceae bacterium]